MPATTESRLAAVEKQLRYQRAVIVALLIILVALVSYGATESVPDVIRARKFEVVNEQGVESAILRSIPGIGAGQLELFSPEGVRTIALTSLITGGHICSFQFNAESPEAYHSCLSGQKITLTTRNTYDPNHNLRPALTLENRDESGLIEVFDGQQRTAVAVGASGQEHSNGGFLKVLGPSAKSSATLSAGVVSGSLELRGEFTSTDAKQTYIAADGISVRTVAAGRTINRLNFVSQGERGVIEANGEILAR